MGKIILLDELTANKIAAGEVIERPASVVKELVENSIDAGSTQIHIEVMHGGMNKIKITDNGYGMDQEDAISAFQRHATSKLKNADDLFNINTLGFRGEALPSIASVAKVVLITKEASEIEGTKVEIYGGKNLNTNPIGTSAGTSIDVTELFYNTPARKKYLKTETTEFGHISDIVTRLAMGNPHISFLLSHNGRQVFRTPGTNKLIDVLSTIYGIEIAKKLVLIKEKNELLTINGVIAKPEVNRANRQQQTFFINGRYVKSKIICYALEEGFHTLIPTGRYPFAVLNLSINPEMIDVNVHPTKMEVRFTKEKDIINYIIQWVQEALGKQKLIPGYNVDNKVIQKEIKESVFITKQKSSPNYTQDEIFSRNLFTKESDLIHTNHKNSGNEYNTKKQINNLETVDNKKIEDEIKIVDDIKLIDDNVTELQEQNILDNCNNIIVASHIEDKAIVNTVPLEETKIVEKALAIYQESHVDIKESPVSYSSKNTIKDINEKIPYMKPLAQIDKTYIIAQGIHGMFMIDQHAAHERVLYEKFLYKDKFRESIVQSLLIPITLELTPNETQVLINNIIIFNELGFVIEHFGGNTFLLRAIPQELTSGDDELLFKDLLDCCLDEITVNKEKLREKVIITMACKGAIKANQILSISEMEELVKLLDETKSPYTCPHGRPTIIHFSQYELEKKFKRVQ